MDVYWLEQTESDVPSDQEWVGSNEDRLLNHMRFPKRRADWKLGRWTAKRAVASYLNIPVSQSHLAGIEILPAPSGTPEAWIANQLAPVTISISHRSGKAVCAVAPPGAALGFDLELIEPRSEGFVSDYFAEVERAAIARALPEDRPLLVTLIWSAKESALKTLRMGLRLDTRCVVVSLAGEPKTPRENSESRSRNTEDQIELCRGLPWQQLLVCIADGRRFAGWWQCADNFVRTLIAEPAPSLPVQILTTTRSSQALA